MAKKDAVSKRLADEIALAELLKTLPAPEELPAPELPAPPTPEELALLQQPIFDAFKAFGLDH